jgi:biotin transporter BioY
MDINHNYFFKQHILSVAKKIGFLVCLSWLYAACSQCVVWIPFLPVPVSLQPAPLFLAVLALGWPGVQAYGVYLLQGAFGAPVFAGMHGGLVRLFGPTGGYLFGFLCSMILLAMLRDVLVKRRWMLMPVLLLATIITFVFGLAQLSFFVPMKHLFTAGLWPFLVGDLIIKPLTICIFWYGSLVIKKRFHALFNRLFH